MVFYSSPRTLNLHLPVMISGHCAASSCWLEVLGVCRDAWKIGRHLDIVFVTGGMNNGACLAYLRRSFKECMAAC